MGENSAEICLDEQNILLADFVLAELVKVLPCRVCLKQLMLIVTSFLMKLWNQIIPRQVKWYHTLPGICRRA